MFHDEGKLYCKYPQTSKVRQMSYYGLERKRGTQKFHGPTYGAQSVTGISGFRHEVCLPGNVQFTISPNVYRGPFGYDVDRYLDALDSVIQHGTSGHLAGMLIEPIQGYTV